MTEHEIEWIDSDSDGRVSSGCSCGWKYSGYGDSAVDQWGGHMRAVGRADRDAEVAKLMFDLGLAHGSIMRLLSEGHTLAVDVDGLSTPPPEWSLAADDAREILAQFIESPTAEEAPNASN